MSSNLEVSIGTEPLATVVAVAGELDLASYPRLEQAIDQVSGSAAETVVLDLAGLEFIDVAGLRAVLRSQERLRAAGKRLALRNQGTGVRRLLALTGLGDALEAAEDPGATG